MPPKSKTTRNMSVVPLQAESRPITPYQQQLNQTEGANRMGADPQPQTRVPADNVNTFIEVMQSLQHSQQQMMEEIRQLKANKTKEKGSQHDPDHVANKKETLARGAPRNAEQRFITMAEVAALLEQKRAKTPKEKTSLSSKSTQQTIPREVWTKGLYPVWWQEGKCSRAREQIYWHPWPLRSRRGLMSAGVFKVTMWLGIHLVHWLKTRINSNLGWHGGCILH